MNPLLVFLAENTSAAAAGLFAGLGLIWLVLALALSVFWIWMLIDCLTSAMPTAEKLLWFLVIFFLHILGALIYFFVKRSGARRPA